MDRVSRRCAHRAASPESIHQSTNTGILIKMIRFCLTLDKFFTRPLSTQLLSVGGRPANCSRVAKPPIRIGPGWRQSKHFSSKKKNPQRWNPSRRSVPPDDPGPVVLSSYCAVSRSVPPIGPFHHRGHRHGCMGSAQVCLSLSLSLCPSIESTGLPVWLSQLWIGPSIARAEVQPKRTRSQIPNALSCVLRESHQMSASLATEE